MAIGELQREHAATVPAPASARRARGRDRTLGVSAASLLLTGAAVLPLTGVIRPTWLVPALMCALVVWAAGVTVRALGGLAVLAPVVQLAAWAAAVTGTHSMLAAAGMLPRSDAILGVIPTPGLIADLPALWSSATTELAEGIAPLAPGAPLTVMLVGAASLLALVLDALAVSLRLPLAAVAAAIAVWIVPPAATGVPTHVLQITCFLAATLLLLAADRRRRAPADAGRFAAAGMAAASVIAALVVAPMLPEPTGSLRGPGAPTRINASLDLGEDLRRLGDAEVLRYVVTEGEAPYLRVATLSSFTGGGWTTDTGRTEPATEALPAVWDEEPSAGSTVVSLEIDVLDLEGPYLPVPYALAALDGVSPAWELSRSNLTVSGGESAAESYTATAVVPQPTREAAQAATARISSPSAEGIANTTVTLPGSALTERIADVAADVVSGEATDYDRLVTLQNWFRSGDFEYSLDAPVADGFDGTDLEAMAAFLDRREGYCIHYASTFAVMARTLDMPSRVVVGYLPGVRSGEWSGQDAVYTVRASQLHAWPEVYFRGIGWVPFEPTPGLGEATAFVPAAIAGGAPDARPSSAPTASPTPTASDAPSSTPEARDESAGSDAPRSPAALLLPLAWVAGVAVLLSLPALARTLLRRRRLRAAARGDAAAAWRELIDTLTDAGTEVHAHDSPRALAARLAQARPGAGDALGLLVSAIEDASYGPPGQAGRDDLSGAVETVRRALTPSPLRRATALAAPRSLLSPRPLLELARFVGTGRSG